MAGVIVSRPLSTKRHNSETCLDYLCNSNSLYKY